MDGAHAGALQVASLPLRAPVLILSGGHMDLLLELLNLAEHLHLGHILKQQLSSCCGVGTILTVHDGKEEHDEGVR